MAGEQVPDSETPLQAVERGLKLKKDGDLPGARAAFQKAIDSRDPEQAPIGFINLAVLLENTGDFPGARASWQKAIDSGHAKWSPHAANWLGVMLEKQKDMAGARAAYQLALDSANTEYSARAGNNLGLLIEKDDPVGARTAYRKAVDAGHQLHSSAAARNLGFLSQKEFDVAGARAAYQRAIDFGHADHAPPAAVSLGVFLNNVGDIAGAYVAYHRAVESGHVDHAAVALYNIGLLEQYRRNDLAAAKQAYERAARTTHSSWAEKAKERLAAIATEEGKDVPDSTAKDAARALKAGMTKDDVRRALGPPTKAWRSPRLGGGAARVDHRGTTPYREHWLYEDVPQGHKTLVVMSASGVLQEDVTTTAGATSEQLGPSLQEGELAELTYPVPARFPERVLPNGDCWRPSDDEVRFYRSLAVPPLVHEAASAPDRLNSCRKVILYLVDCFEDEVKRSSGPLCRGALRDHVSRDHVDLLALDATDIPCPVEVVDRYYDDAVQFVDAIEKI